MDDFWNRTFLREVLRKGVSGERIWFQRVKAMQTRHAKGQQVSWSGSEDRRLYWIYPLGSRSSNAI